MTLLLSKPNIKVGKNVRGFSIPADVTCPGATELCRQHCYAKHRRFANNIVSSANEKRLSRAESREFAREMIETINRLRRRSLVRIHVSGDFYSAAYVRKWIAIIKACPETRFWAYTRSWRLPRLRKALRELAELPNMSLWWSTDRETHRESGRPPRWKNVRVAWMLVPEDCDRVPAYVDLVFRVMRDTRQTTVAGKPVCPAENGINQHHEVTCTQCGICYKEPICLQQS